MSTYTFTADQVTEAITAAVAERGADYVYPVTRPGWSVGDDGSTCRYVVTEDGTTKPGCIVGDVFARLGVPLDVMAQFETDIHAPGSKLYDGAAKGLIAHLDIDVPMGVKRGLQEAQGAQDSGKPWGDASDDYRMYANDDNA